MLIDRRGLAILFLIMVVIAAGIAGITFGILHRAESAVLIGGSGVALLAAAGALLFLFLGEPMRCRTREDEGKDSDLSGNTRDDLAICPRNHAKRPEPALN